MEGRTCSKLSAATGAPKILKHCSLPLTAAHEVDYVVTELCVLHYNGC